MNKERMIIGKLISSSVISRHQTNPILTSKDIPYPSTLVFNAGVTKFQGSYVMVFRNDLADETGKRIYKINIGLAFSEDGIKWEVQPKPCFELANEEIWHAYDPRLTVIEGRCYMCFAVNTRHGIRGSIAVTDDFDRFEILSMSTPDNRNMVLFPEKVNDMFVRLERPFPVYGRGEGERFDIWISDSPDSKYWGNSDLLLGGEDVPFSNTKIGPGAPPVKTKKGWLTTFHAVDFDETRGENGWGQESWQKRYTAGIMLLDLNDPRKIIGLYKKPLIAPEAPYEISGGYRNNVIFPGGMILEESGEVKIYYGAADTVICLAIAHIDDLLNLCVSKE